jgi:DNA-binding NarL/FixJ family response regulator
MGPLRRVRAWRTRGARRARHGATGTAAGRRYDDAHGRTGVVVADAHAIVRDGLSRVLHQAADLAVLGAAPDGEGALDLVERHRPALVIMDPRVPGIGGVAAIRRLRTEHPGVPVLLFATHRDDLVREGLAAGAGGAILKDSEAPMLLAAVREVAAGEPYIDERILPDLLRMLPRSPPADADGRRDERILGMLVAGWTRRGISERLTAEPEVVAGALRRSLARIRGEDHAAGGPPAG